ncbi:MAG: hypothetical protein K1060chlam2_01401 [Chlamydiae bacterium]|nr:hypothetical protein [Chlamydiota bacterium]
MHLDRLLETLAEELKLDAIPQMDKSGSFKLKIHALTPISVRELEPGLFLSAKIMELPKEGNKESLYIYLMKANLVGQGTGGAAIGIDSSEKYLTLSQTLPFEVNYKLFHETLEDFLNYIDYWKEEVPTLL